MASKTETLNKDLFSQSARKLKEVEEIDKQVRKDPFNFEKNSAPEKKEEEKKEAAKEEEKKDPVKKERKRNEDPLLKGLKEVEKEKGKMISFYIEADVNRLLENAAEEAGIDIKKNRSRVINYILRQALSRNSN